MSSPRRQRRDGDIAIIAGIVIIIIAGTVIITIVGITIITIIAAGDREFADLK
ncbi:hypothetical protein JQ609_10655 [Bradyrhizobium sp. AUGA SZCCT0169]|uniref:hypothetical protein n=1 Tax=Bradyrhizobium sp. AUGA SZCCT0169 TaxID=2807663 RepID=UPI001BAC21EF|nr:hypothetical protein [Bradyrhizobium sp. AUGA SZCCT0169]MBR1247394.1 hypothetical protein [Bradyrhizobium sp. AUGA SZCCT0169]